MRIPLIDVDILFSAARNTVLPFLTGHQAGELHDDIELPLSWYGKAYLLRRRVRQTNRRLIPARLEAHQNPRRVALYVEGFSMVRALQRYLFVLKMLAVTADGLQFDRVIAPARFVFFSSSNSGAGDFDAHHTG